MDDQEHAALLHARYGTQVKPEHMIWNAQVEALLQHHSVRTFLPDPLPEGAIETMVAAAQSASSSSNLHQWSVIAVDDPKLKQQLQYLSRSDAFGGATAPFVTEAPVVLLWVADMARNFAIIEQQEGEAKVLEHLDAFLMPAIDAAIAAQNAVVAAESLGLGAVYMGSMRNHARELADLMGLPKYSFVVFGMPVGIPDPARQASVRPRPDQSVVLHRNRYETRTPEQWVEEYEAVFRDWREVQGMKPKAWADAVVYGASKAYMDGRENYRQTVQDRGFLLR